MSKKILIVDDSASMRQLVSFALRKAGHEVAEAANGQEGLQKLEKDRFAVIVTDLNMPVMDGIEFIKKLRAIPATKYTPVLMLTTESQESKKQAGKAAGATGWIVKPFQPDKLLGAINRVLG